MTNLLPSRGKMVHTSPYRQTYKGPMPAFTILIRHYLAKLLNHFRKLHPRLWADRAIIWLGAVVTGATVVAFVRMTDFANAWFSDARTGAPGSHC